MARKVTNRACPMCGAGLSGQAHEGPAWPWQAFEPAPPQRPVWTTENFPPAKIKRLEHWWAREFWQPWYDAYLNSDLWAQRRSWVMRRAGNQCERCGRAAYQVHHRTYDRVGQELPDDLVALCDQCHMEVHGRDK